MHDTPPPTTFSDGSLNGEFRDDFTAITPSGGRWIHRRTRRPGSTKDPLIEAVRVQSGNGDNIYQDLNPTGILIQIDFADSVGAAGDVKISSPADFTVDSDERLIAHGPTGAKGRQKYSHPGKGGRTFKVSHIKITKGPATVFEVNAPTTYEEEYRVMIWHADDI